MQSITDWAALWRELVAQQRQAQDSENRGGDAWHGRARSFDARVLNRGPEADPFQEFLSNRADGSRILEIGAGTGRWTLFLAKHAQHVTAIEPSGAMLEVLHEKALAAGVDNLDVIQGYWPEASSRLPDPARFDISICAHAMYFNDDLPGFVRRMTDVTTQLCCLVLRFPAHQNVMAEAAKIVWGQPHDSPNFVIAYNVLLEMGLRPDVLIDPKPWQAWTSSSIDEALAKVKRRLNIESAHRHDRALEDLLRRRLEWRGDQYIWPVAVYSAFAYWRV